MEGWWPLRFLQRLHYVTTLAMMPIEFVTMIVGLGIALVVFAAIAIAAGIMTHAIPDTTTASFLTEVGTRLTDILHAQKVY